MHREILLITDGLERDDSQNLDFEINRLSLFTNNIIWLNPLLRYEKFEPKVNSIKTILRHVDKHVPIHNINYILFWGCCGARLHARFCVISSVYIWR